MMRVYKYPVRSDWAALLARPLIDNSTLEKSVQQILDDVKREGDSALKMYSEKFDQYTGDEFLVTEAEIAEAVKNVSDELKRAIETAKQNIHRFHAAQRDEVLEVETMPGVVCRRKSVAIEKVGLYIPGGTAPLFSTVLMLAVPAGIAGCKEIVLCSPPEKNGRINPAVLYAAYTCGVTRIYKLGGVQAIAAMAYGTKQVQRVDKIFGPGNQYVTCAKQLVNKNGIAIDMPAGPSEVAVLADETCVPEFVAADLLSQAEHGSDSQVILVTTSQDVIELVLSQIQLQIKSLSRKEIAEAALKNSRAILVNTIDEAVDLLNEYAAEHLILACDHADEVAERITNAGSIFIGNYSCESAGDYASGTNHTLPTNGYARAYSGVSLDSFVKKITLQKLSAEGLKNIGPSIEILAAAEGLDAHRNAVTIRLKKINAR